MQEIHQAYLDAENGAWSSRPVMEMCIPSALDPTIAPAGKHVVSLFVQYTPYTLKNGKWDDATRAKFAQHGLSSSFLLFDCILN
jgi:phytoene dehydrogenase-like protein